MENKKRGGFGPGRSTSGRQHFTRRSDVSRAEKVDYNRHGDLESRSYSSGDKPSYGERKSYGKSQGGRKPYGEGRPHGEGKPYGERKSFGEHKSFGGSRSHDEGKPYGSRSAGPRKPYQKKESGIDRMIEKSNRSPREMSDNDSVKFPVSDVMRLNKYIAASGVCSRREADTFIQAGVVTVNGEVVTELGTKINAVTDDIRFNGERLKGENKVYLVMNKPKGYVTTLSDPHADKTVMELIRGCKTRVFPVGRLDKSTTGVLMFTNDGEMAEKLTHPSFDKKKIYQVIVDHALTDEDRDKILSGIELQDGIIAADELEFVDATDHRKLGIQIHSGKNRIVRRIFESLGYDVRALDRVYFAGLTKKGLKKGEWRYLTEGEVNILKMGAYV